MAPYHWPSLYNGGYEARVVRLRTQDWDDVGARPEVVSSSISSAETNLDASASGTGESAADVEQLRAHLRDTEDRLHTLMSAAEESV